MANDAEHAFDLDYESSPPEPASLLEALRAFGYSLPTAVADLIDNSIAANANNVWVDFNWDGPASFIAIKDDGAGMSEEELRQAMRPGSQSPLVVRSEKDLGRFGLGLKTASFSQCRRLTVASRKLNSDMFFRCWDLDYVNEVGEWRLLKSLPESSINFLEENMAATGTVVLWEKMDHVVANAPCDDSKAYDRFLEAIESVRRHLEMVFHRFLERPNGLRLWINKNKVVPWDPFLKSEAATQTLPPEPLPFEGQVITVTSYILPHQSKLAPETHKRAAGLRGWNAQQGFYVYRNNRLLVGGDWLNLGFVKEEHSKLARISIDIPNSMDSEWQIDVKKSRAKPPAGIRQDLKRIASATRKQAIEVYRFRGKVTARKNAQDFVFLWEEKRRRNKIFYSINREHPLVVQTCKTGDKASINALLSLLEETLPYTHIMVSSSGEAEKCISPYENVPPDAVIEVIKTTYLAIVNSGTSPEEAKIKLLSMDPFKYFEDYFTEMLVSFEEAR